MKTGFGRIIALLKPHRKLFGVALTLELVNIITRLIVPRLTARVVNDVITDGLYDLLYPLCGAILALTVARALFTYIRACIFHKISQDITFDLRSGLYDHLQEMPWAFFD